MNLRTVALCVFATLPLTVAEAQLRSVPATESLRVKPNHVFAELLGNGGLYSINVERRLMRSVALRLGATKWSSIDLVGDQPHRRYRLGLAMVNWLSSGKSLSGEFGLGMRAGRIQEESPGAPSRTSAAVTCAYGLRYALDPGILFRAAAVPTFELEEHSGNRFSLSVGLSVGVVF